MRPDRHVRTDLAKQPVVVFECKEPLRAQEFLEELRSQDKAHTREELKLDGVDLVNSLDRDRTVKIVGKFNMNPEGKPGFAILADLDEYVRRAGKLAEERGRNVWGKYDSTFLIKSSG